MQAALAACAAMEQSAQKNSVSMASELAGMEPSCLSHV